MTTTAMPQFTYGGEAADEAAEANKPKGSFRRTHYLVDPGKDKAVLLRYVTDFHPGPKGWLSVMHHQWVPTKPKPADYPEGAKWPEAMPHICRNDKAFRGDPAAGRPAFYETCWACETKPVNKFGNVCKPTVRVFAIAALREEVIGTQEMVSSNIIPADMVGKRVGFKDQVREVTYTDKDGNEVTKKEIALVVVQKAMNNYFGGLLSLGRIYGTVCDRDFFVQQKNEKKDIEFYHVPMEPTPDFKPGTESWKKYEDAIEEQGLNLGAIVMEQSSDEWIAKWFDPAQTFKWAKKDDDKSASSDPTSSAPQSSGGSSAAPAANDAPDPERLKAIQDRIRGRGNAQQAQQATETSQDAHVATEAQPEQQEAQQASQAQQGAAQASGGMLNF